MADLTLLLRILKGTLDMISIMILVIGVLKATFDFIISEVKNRGRVKTARQNNFIKNYLGTYILLSLEVLIAADIIETIMNPTTDDVLILGAIVVIRTVISYFLHAEISESPSEKESKETSAARDPS